MCAIVGIISHIPDYQHSALLTPMLAAMKARGPDKTDIEILGNHGCFGHNRLAIIDLHERAKQPMWDHSQRYCLSYNGEIYNFQSLRSELISLGHEFSTTSDSEVLIQAWSQWGVAAISRLVGMFAFAVWDKVNQQLYLVRDRMGEKPLYYAAVNNHLKNGLLFASELKGLLQYPFLQKNISMVALSHYLSYNYTSTDQVIFKNFFKVPPASYLRYDLRSHQCEVKEYWSLAECFNNKAEIPFVEAKHKLDQLLADSVKQCSVADVPLGAFLSGGIDSASIVSYLRDNQQVNTYGIGFKEKSYNELPVSIKTANYLGVSHTANIITADVNQLAKIISAYDEPFADTSLIPTYLLCAFAKNAVTVSLSGDGGDELFGGYLTYQADRYHQLMQYIPIQMRRLLYRMSHRYPTSFNKISLDYKIKQFFRGSILDLKRAHLSWREVFSEQQKKLLFQTHFHAELDYDPNQALLHFFEDVKGCHFLDQAMYVDMKTWLADDILVKVDRASMANSLEVRAPFLDHRLVEFAARMPVNYKIKRNKGKHILKSSYNDRFPTDVIRRSKKGFNSPISHWLANDFFELAYDMTTSYYLSAWFELTYIKQLWIEHKKGACDHGHRLFNLLCLAHWSKQYFHQ